MVTKTIDDATQIALNELSRQEVTSSYSYFHELLWYGVEAIAHILLMQEAQANISSGIPVEKLAGKFDLIFPRRDYFIGPLKAVERIEIFVPKHAYLIHSEGDERKVRYFDGDYRNRFRYMDDWADKKSAFDLMKRDWQISDLKDPELVKRGLRFGRDMWRKCYEGFEKYKEGTGTLTEKPTPQHILDLGRKLIAYYSSIVSSTNTD